MEELKQWYEQNGKQKSKVYQANARCAGGIVEALEKLSLGPHLSPRDRMDSNGIQPGLAGGQPGCAQREVVEFNTFFEKWMNGEVPNDSTTFQRLTSVIVSLCPYCLTLSQMLAPDQSSLWFAGFRLHDGVSLGRGEKSPRIRHYGSTETRPHEGQEVPNVDRLHPRAEACGRSVYGYVARLADV